MPRPPKKPYVPAGKMIPLLKAMEAQPDRTFTGREVAQMLGDVEIRAVASFVFYAERAGRIFKRVVGSGNKRQLLLRVTPFPAGVGQPPKPSNDVARQGWKDGRAVPVVAAWNPEDDIRVQRVVPGWTPPKMVCTRRGA